MASFDRITRNMHDAVVLLNLEVLNLSVVRRSPRQSHPAAVLGSIEGLIAVYRGIAGNQHHHP